MKRVPSSEFGWQLILSTVLFIALTVFAAMNASEFDETEIRMILEVMGAFGVVQYGIHKARNRNCPHAECPMRD